MRNNQVRSFFYLICFWEGPLARAGRRRVVALATDSSVGLRVSYLPAALCWQAGGQANPGSPDH